VDIAPENYISGLEHWQKRILPIIVRRYEAKIDALGGIDLQVLGIGGMDYIGSKRNPVPFQISKPAGYHWIHITSLLPVKISKDFSSQKRESHWE